MKSNIFILSALACISSFSYADYIATITKNHSDYKEGGTWSEWGNDGSSYDCINDKEVEDFYYNVSFSQEQTCLQKQTRTRNIDNEIITDSRIVSVTTTNEAIGTHLENSCLNILTKNYATSDGVYPLQIDSVTSSFYCDMTTNGGGWTLVSTKASSTTAETFISGYNSTLTNPTINSDNLYNGNWAAIGFTQVKYDINNYNNNFYFPDINTDTLRNYAKTAIFVSNPNQTYRPTCYTGVDSTGTAYANCGAGNTLHHGWVHDPFSSSLGTAFCWYMEESSGLIGSGDCTSSASTKGRIWVR